MDNPTFAARIASLKEIATQLHAFAETITLEAQRMEGVQSRFPQRVGKRVRRREPAQGS